MSDKIENAIKILDLELSTEQLQCVLNALNSNSNLGKQIAIVIQNREDREKKRSKVKGIQEAIDKLQNAEKAIVYYDNATNMIYTETYNTREELSMAFNTPIDGTSLMFTLTDKNPVINAEKIIKQIVAMIH